MYHDNVSKMGGVDRRKGFWGERLGRWWWRSRKIEKEALNRESGPPVRGDNRAYQVGDFGREGARGGADFPC